MIVNIRGTSGSGKSTIVRTVMDRYHNRTPSFIDGRKQPLGYTCYGTAHDGTAGADPHYGTQLVVLGHYETPCGGTDTITKTDDVYRLVREAVGAGHHVIYEGIMVSDDVSRCLGLHRDGLPLLVIGLTTPIEICLQGIQARRDARGDSRPLNPKNTQDRAVRHARTISKLKDAGVDARKLDREHALLAVLEALGIDQPEDHFEDYRYDRG